MNSGLISIQPRTPCECLFVDSCCSPLVCISLTSSAPATHAPTLALAQVLEEMQSVMSDYHVQFPSGHRFRLMSTIRSGERVLVVNVHFEPDVVLRDLRGRLRRFSTHWPHNPEALREILGDFIFCEPAEGRFNARNHIFTEGDAGKTALSRSFFLHFFDVAQLHFTTDSAVDGTLRTLSRTCRAFINVPMAEGT